MNNESSNRVVKDLLVWKHQETRCAELFSSSVLNEKAFLKARLHFYDKIHQQYKRTSNQEEKLYVQILKGERRKLEKALYPGLFDKLFRKMEQVVRANPKEKMPVLEISKESCVTDVREQAISSQRQVASNSKETKSALDQREGKGASHAKEHRITRESTQGLLPQKEGNGTGKKQGL